MDSSDYRRLFRERLSNLPEGVVFRHSSPSPLSIAVEVSPGAAVVVVSGAPHQASLKTDLGTVQGCEREQAVTLKASASNAANTPGEN